MTTFTRHPHTGEADEITALLVEAPWRSTRTVRTIPHHLLEADITIYTLRPAEPRAGQLRAWFTTAAEAYAAEEFFASPAVFSIDPVDPPDLAARFVVTGGQLTVEQGSAGGWAVTIPWMEATP